MVEEKPKKHPIEEAEKRKKEEPRDPWVDLKKGYPKEKGEEKKA